jgi:hypothetical protein
MQFPTVEECDFDRRFLFDEYVAISHRYDLKRVSLKIVKCHLPDVHAYADDTHAIIPFF